MLNRSLIYEHYAGHVSVINFNAYATRNIPRQHNRVREYHTGHAVNTANYLMLQVPQKQDNKSPHLHCHCAMYPSDPSVIAHLGDKGN